MAIAVAFSGFATVGFQMLVEPVFNAIMEKLSLFENGDKQSKKLAKVIEKIKLLLDDVTQVGIAENMVKSWARVLSTISYNVDDLLDDFIVQSTLSNLIISPSVATQLDAVNEELEALVKDIAFFRTNGQQKRSKGSSETTSFLYQTNKVVVWRKEMMEIVKMLTDENLTSSGQSFGVVSIIGLVGIGKTTLAAQVYHCDELDKCFHRKMWISVPYEFDLNQICRQILESYTRKSVDLIHLDALQVQLQRVLAGVKFLIVFDGLAHRDQSGLSILLKSLSSGHTGSKVLLTTQDGKVATLMGSMHSFKLDRLSDDDSWLIFKEKVILNDLENVPPYVIEMENQVKQICEGVPLVADSLGKFLSTHLDLGMCIQIPNDEGLELELLEGEGNIISSISRTCYHLPPHLRRCLSFCSFFKVGHIFKKEILITMWIALGYVQTNGNIKEEDIASQYFKNLLELSMFQQDGVEIQSKYVLPRVIHLAARHMCFEECYGCGSKPTRVYQDIRHAVVAHNRAEFQVVSKCKKLRTLISPIILEPQLSHLITVLTYLRVLDFSGSRLMVLPDSISNLKHLRYMDLFGAEIYDLCNGICSLKNLQTLRLRHCLRLRSLPERMNELSNLRHLVLDVRSPLRSIPLGILDLPKLQTLGAFFVDPSTSHIRHLTNRDEFKGTFGISNLEELSSDTSVAEEANLIQKKDIQRLHLRWTRIDLPTACFEVLHHLRPHKKIRELRLFGYCALEFPTWIGDESYSDLEMIMLSECEFHSAPRFPKIQYLKVLSLRTLGIAKLQDDLTDGFPNLEMLIVQDMRNMRVWEGLRAECYPNLRVIRISDCPRLAALPPLRLLPKLKILHITNCGTLQHFPEDGLPVLDYLLIEKCATLEENCTQGADKEKISQIVIVEFR